MNHTGKSITQAHNLIILIDVVISIIITPPHTPHSLHSHSHKAYLQVTMDPWRVAQVHQRHSLADLDEDAQDLPFREWVAVPELNDVDESPAGAELHQNEHFRLLCH
jgi:hypothetical protein